MRTLTKILIGVFAFTLGTSSSNQKHYENKPKKIREYSIEKKEICFKDEKLEKSFCSLEKEVLLFKEEIKSTRDSVWQQ